MLSAATSPPRLITLIFLTGLSTLSLNMFLPSLVNIAENFETDYAIVSLSIAGYLAVTAILQIMIGSLSDRFGRRPVLLAALFIFSIASLGCLLAENIWVFLFFRFMQGAIIAGSALSPAVVRDMMPAKQAASILGYIAMAMAIAPMLGPMVDELFGWRSSFLAYVVIGLTVFTLAWLDLGETNKMPSKSFGRQVKAYPALLRSSRFWGYALCTAFSTGAFYAFLAGAPLVTRMLFNMSAGTLGIYLGSITGGFFLGSFIAARFSKNYSLATMMLAGRIIACSGLLLGLALLALGIVHEFTLFGATIFVGIGNGVTMPSSNAGAMSVRADLAGSASGPAGALTVGGGAILTGVSGVIVTENTAAMGLLWMMFGASFLGLLCAVWVLFLDRE
ncbi:MAG: MFS transporter [Rhodobacteraceae bacterium]|nr:MFS transporter [Paracoccaceae bacterium]